MEVLLWILAAVCVGVGIAGIIVPVLPGAPLVWLGLLLAAAPRRFGRSGCLCSRTFSELGAAVSRATAGPGSMPREPDPSPSFCTCRLGT